MSPRSGSSADASSATGRPAPRWTIAPCSTRTSWKSSARSASRRSPQRRSSSGVIAWPKTARAHGTPSTKVATQLHAIFQHTVDYHGPIANPVAKVKRLRESYDAARFDFYSPEEIDKLVIAAATGAHRDPRRPAVSDLERALRSAEDRQDSAIYLTAALSGLRRGELLALRWDDVDFEQSSIRVFEGYSANRVGTPKSRKSRTVPMVEEIARSLSDLKTRGEHTAKDDLVFVSREGTHVDGSALRRRYLAMLDAAGLRRLRFHDLRHTFGLLAINVASIVQVQAWMGHADIKTTMRYLHHKSRADDAQLLSAAFRPTKRSTNHRHDS
jgi:integrase